MSPVADCNLKDFLEAGTISQENRSFLRTFYDCLAAALRYLHENRVRHKDIKPQVRARNLAASKCGLTYL